MGCAASLPAWHVDPRRSARSASSASRTRTSRSPARARSWRRRRVLLQELRRDCEARARVSPRAGGRIRTEGCTEAAGPAPFCVRDGFTGNCLSGEMFLSGMGLTTATWLLAEAKAPPTWNDALASVSPPDSYRGNAAPPALLGRSAEPPLMDSRGRYQTQPDPATFRTRKSPSTRSSRSPTTDGRSVVSTAVV